MNKVIIDLTRYAQSLESTIRIKNKEIERLEHLNKYLIDAQEKRDELLSQALEENRRLKDLIVLAERAVGESRREALPSNALSHSISKKGSGGSQSVISKTISEIKMKRIVSNMPISD